MSKSLLIAFEGIDGCGKSTQLRLLGEYLAKRGRKSCSSAEPTDYPTGKMLRRALSGEDPRTPTEMAAMFTLDRIHHNVAPDGIRASLAAGLDVLTDRYYYSSLAYQGSLCDYEWVLDIREQCRIAGVGFHYHQTGAKLFKDGRLYLVPKDKQCEQAERANIDLKAGF